MTEEARREIVQVHGLVDGWKVDDLDLDVNPDMWRPGET